MFLCGKGKKFNGKLKLKHFEKCTTGKTTAMRSITVGETGICRHHRGPIVSPLEPFGQCLEDIEGFKRAIN